MSKSLAAFRTRQAATLARPPIARPVYPPGVNIATQRLLDALFEQWQAFLTLTGRQNTVPPQLDALEDFWWTYAEESKGRLDTRPSLGTLHSKSLLFERMFFYRFDHLFSDDLKEGVATFIDNLTEEENLGIRDNEYPKLFADATDVAQIIEYMIKYDTHPYTSQRMFAQILFAFLLMAEDGERGGAITLSAAYRKCVDTNETLCYKDMKLFLLPDSAGSSLNLRLDITFRNRKFGRVASLHRSHIRRLDGTRRAKPGNRTPDKLKTQSYYLRKDPSMCPLRWFLAIAFLDNAFQDQQSPKDFSNLKASRSQTPIPIKSSMLSLPFMRQVKGSQVTDKMLSYDSLLAQGKRIVKSAGFPQRFTFYNIRRGCMLKIVNDPNMTETARLHALGHNSRSVQLRYYLPRAVTYSVGAAFRGEKETINRSEVLSMHLDRDYSVLREPPQSPRRKALIAALDNVDLDALECLQAMVDYLATTGKRPTSNKPRCRACRNAYQKCHRPDDTKCRLCTEKGIECEIDVKREKGCSTCRSSHTSCQKSADQARCDLCVRRGLECVDYEPLSKGTQEQVNVNEATSTALTIGKRRLSDEVTSPGKKVKIEHEGSVQG